MNIKTFSRLVKEAREGWDEMTAEAYDNNYRAYLADEVMSKAYLFRAAQVSTAATMRDALIVASGRAQQFGATDAQINEIIRRAAKEGNFSFRGDGALTKSEASRIIGSMAA